jgi:hypothetical protein
MARFTMTRGGTAAAGARTIGWALTLVVAAALATGAAQGQRGRGPQGPPNISGKWSGAWSSFNPAQATAEPREVCKQLDADVVQDGDAWIATFEGDCGRPYKYKISMKGRLAGGVVLFTGSVDLGAKDGGVFDWVGRATGGEFIGFYTSAYSTGYFNLTRTK